MGNFRDVPQANLLAWYGKTKPDTTKTHSPIKRNVLQHYTQKLKPHLVASYDIQPGNGEGLFWCRCFINLSITYLLRHIFPLTYSARAARHNEQCKFTITNRAWFTEKKQILQCRPSSF